MRAHEPRQLGSEVSLRPVTPADLEFMFQIGLDPESNAMAGTKPRGQKWESTGNAREIGGNSHGNHVTL